MARLTGLTGLTAVAAVVRRAARLRFGRSRVLGGRSDTGSGTVWLVVCALLGCAAFTVVLSAGAVVGARHRAESAADLSALAAAGGLLLDTDGGCGRAGAVAAAQSATVVSCSVDREADAVEVVAEVQVTGLPLRLPVGPARARARAGPVRAAVAPTDEDARAAVGEPVTPAPDPAVRGARTGGTDS
ncbi:Rv3654c family TadE-like protein [Kitasatospora sp. NBC_00458]|uniref:Rv3654c family TadE-like protein n=1 Tax=Kitasatospora sp. NBC_00458 TaxID=2903568 RepID=UPI002E19AE69